MMEKFNAHTHIVKCHGKRSKFRIKRTVILKTPILKKFEKLIW